MSVSHAAADTGNDSLEEITTECSSGVRASLDLLRNFEELNPAEQCEISNALAHDFNDMLSVIIGYASMVRNELGDDSIHRDEMDEILQVARRASKIAKQLARVGRKLPKPLVEQVCNECGD